MDRKQGRADRFTAPLLNPETWYGLSNGDPPRLLQHLGRVFRLDKGRTINLFQIAIRSILDRHRRQSILLNISSSHSMPAVRVGENTSSVDGDVDTIRPVGEWSTIDKVTDGVIDIVQGNHDEVSDREGEKVEELVERRRELEEWHAD